MNRRKVLAIGAHDDDVIIGIGGVLLTRHKNDDIRVQICTNGENSHVVVLNIHDNPSQKEVAHARREELERAYNDFRDAGLALAFDQWEYPDTCGVLTEKKDEVKEKIASVLTSFKPNVIYFQALDAHEDHRLVYNAVSEVLREVGYQGEAYFFSIWTKELAAQRPEVDAQKIQELTGTAETVDVAAHLPTKRLSLFRFASQVQVWPYLDWQPQQGPILDANFLKYFLRGEEIITPFKQNIE